MYSVTDQSVSNSCSSKVVYKRFKIPHQLVSNLWFPRSEGLSVMSLSDPRKKWDDTCPECVWLPIIATKAQSQIKQAANSLLPAPDLDLDF